MRIMRAGRARISARRPSALGECDRCGFVDNLDKLMRQNQWAGNTLRDTGLLVCRPCFDIPQDQFRSPILPADPFPRRNPRPSPNFTQVPASVGQPLPTSPENQGFTIYTLGFTTGIFTLDLSLLDGADVLE